MLERDRCLEEESRLVIERRSLQEWFAEEWKITNEAMNAVTSMLGVFFFLSVDIFPGDETSVGLLHQLQLYRDHLLRLCAGWQKPLESLDTGVMPLEAWGPLDAELLAARVDAVTSSVRRWDEDNSDSEDEPELEDEEEDAGLAEALELLELSDGFRDHYKENTM